jgi:hypothetical protein
MAIEIIRYLDSIKCRLRLAPPLEKEVLQELYTHLEERMQELEEQGFSEEEAARIALQTFGSVGAIARQMNQVHGSGSWKEALLASLPHLLVAVIFAFHLWESSFWLLVTLGCIFGIAAYGWRHNKPTWLYPWLGYSLLPVLMVGLFLLSLLGQSLAVTPGGGWGTVWWAWAGILLYIPFAVWLLISITLHTVRRDWLLGSLTALPLPGLVGWFLAVQREGAFLEYSRQRLFDLAPWITFSFLSLAGVVALFIRLRQRELKAGVLLSAGVFILALLMHSNKDKFGLATFLILVLVTLVVLLGPAVLERKLGHGEAEAPAWNYAWIKQSFKDKP